MANVIIDIAAEFTGNKAFKQAESSTDKLTKNVKKLAGAAGLAFGTAQVIAFGKASVKAALDAQAQQDRLASLVKTTVGASQLQIQSLNDQAAALQDIGVVSKENITQTQSQLATFNLQIDTIKQLTPAILDYVTAEKGAAASADQFKQMTNGLAQALNGNFASLTKVGFVLDETTKKTIKNGTESERAAALVAVLDSTYKDFNKNLAKTDAGQMQILANAAQDAQEIIGTGLLDAVKMLGNDDSVANLAQAMQDVAFYTGDAIRGVGVLIGYLQSIPGANILFDAFKVFNKSTPLGLLVELGKQARKTAEMQGTSASALAHLAELQSKYAIETLAAKKKLTAEEQKALKAAKLKAALDKANLALNKGQDVFDMDKIQIAAALTNQAEQLGRATSASQALQIANDTARLNVKRSILALEDAIASKDEASIVAATNKLNADLKVLGALIGQSLKLSDIKSILESLKPADLINLANLDAAIAKMLELLRLQGTKPPTSGVTSGVTGGNAGTGSGNAGTGSGDAGTGSGDVGTSSLYTIPKNTKNFTISNPIIKKIADEANYLSKNVNDQFLKSLEFGSDIGSAVRGANYQMQAEAARQKLIDSVSFKSSPVAEASFKQGLEAGLSISDAAMGARYAGAYAASTGATIINNFNGVVGDPNAVAELMDQVLREARDRGTLTIA
jgi:hypothetical protein